MTSLARAAVATRQWPGLWVVALGGFLARGGIVLFLLPMAPLPSTVGLATLVGPTSVTAAGLTPDSIVRLVVVVTLGVAWLLAGNAIGAMTDLAVVDAAAPAADPAGRHADPRRIARLVGLRLAALVPLGVVVAITARPVGDLVYQELILPRDLATPLILRVVQGAQVQVASHRPRLDRRRGARRHRRPPGHPRGPSLRGGHRGRASPTSSGARCTRSWRRSPV